MKPRRPPFYFASIATLAFIAGAALAWHRWGDQWLKRTGEIQGSEISKQQNATEVSPAVRLVSHSETNLSDTETTPPDAFLSETSWENPFQKELWNSSLAMFEESSLCLLPAGQATFLRNYRRVRVDFTIGNVEPGSADSGPGPFELHFVSSDDGSANILVVDGKEARIEQRDGGSTTLVRSTEFPSTESKPHEFHVHSTGTRLLVRLRHRMLLNCPQPGQPSGFLIRFASQDQDVYVRNLRIEGE